MTDLAIDPNPQRSYWVGSHLKLAATTLTGVIAVFVALKAMGYDSGSATHMQDHVFRIIAFASLTVWMTLTVGLRRRAAAAMCVLAFASFLELVIVPSRGEMMGTLASANLGIVFAYCGLQLYWYRLVESRRAKANATPAS